MTRRTLLVPLFAAALILAPAKLAGRMAASPGGGSPAAAARTGSAEAQSAPRTAPWNPPLHRQTVSPQG